MVNKITSPISNNDLVEKVNGLIDHLPNFATANYDINTDTTEFSGYHTLSINLSTLFPNIQTNAYYKIIVTESYQEDKLCCSGHNYWAYNTTLDLKYFSLKGSSSRFTGTICIEKINNTPSSVGYKFPIITNGRAELNSIYDFESNSEDFEGYVPKGIVQLPKKLITANVEAMDQYLMDSTYANCKSYKFSYPVNGSALNCSASRYTFIVEYQDDYYNWTIYKATYNTSTKTIDLYCFCPLTTTSSISMYIKVIALVQQNNYYSDYLDQIMLMRKSTANNNSNGNIVCGMKSAYILPEKITVTDNGDGTYNHQFTLLCNGAPYILFDSQSAKHYNSSYTEYTSSFGAYSLRLSTITLVSDYPTAQYLVFNYIDLPKSTNILYNYQKTNGTLDIYDKVITQNSGKPITSGAVYTAIGDIETLINAL